MKRETKFADWLRTGGHSEFILQLNDRVVPEKKFTVVPDRLLETVLDDALQIAVNRLNRYLPENTSINISSIDIDDIKAEFARTVADRISEVGVPLDANDPVISSAIRRNAEQLNARFQQSGLGVSEYIWRSSDDEKVRSQHRENDDQRFLWTQPPPGGHTGEAYNCRCFAEPVIEGIVFPEGAVCDIFNGSMLKETFPRASQALLNAIAEEIGRQIVVGKLNSPERLAHFFGQVRQEVGDEMRLHEILNYLPGVLVAKFSYFRRRPSEAQQFGRTADHPADRHAIANHAYANRNGNGNIASGDGWRFRGRGIFQLTGRANYRAFSHDHSEMFGEVVDFEKTPDLVALPAYAVRSAMFFWVKNGFFTIADRGVSQSVANDITRIINRDTGTYTDRWKHVENFRNSGVFGDICGFSVARPRFEDR